MNRRSLLTLAAGLAAAPALAQAAGAAPADTAPAGTTSDSAAPATPDSGLYGIRALGKESAPVQVMEFYSLTCPHCAEFETATLPKVKEKFIDTGKLRMIFHDFPLDGVALMAAQVARSLPPSQYYPFVSALFASQDKWAFASDLHTPQQYQQALFRYAALAGMSRTDFDAAINNDKLKKFILDERSDAEKKYNIDATPTFIVNGKKHAGAMDVQAFAQYAGLTS